MHLRKILLSLLAVMFLSVACAVESLPVSPVAPPSPITITFAGDVMLGGAVGKQVKKNGVLGMLSGVKKIITTDDLTVANLECPVSTRGKAVKKTYTFRANPSVVPGLRRAGIDVVTLGNNHAMDYGRTALLDTLSYLRQAAILAVGAGVNAVAAYQPALTTVGTRRIALLGFSRVLPNRGWYAGRSHPGITSAYDPARVLADIKTARQQADLVIVYFHWGVERALTPESYQRLLARKCIDAGADLIIGSHPHVLQGFEYYRGKLIAYSLGNFLFNSHTGSTILLQTTFSEGKLTSVQVIPCGYARYRPVIATKPKVKLAILNALQARSYGVNISSDGLITSLHEQ